MHFTVSCTSCQTEFPIDADKVPLQGIHARCSTCEGVFFVERPTVDESTAEVPPDRQGIESSWAEFDADPPESGPEEVSAEPVASSDATDQHGGIPADDEVEEAAAEFEVEGDSEELSDVSSSTYGFDSAVDPVDESHASTELDGSGTSLPLLDIGDELVVPSTADPGFLTVSETAAGLRAGPSDSASFPADPAQQDVAAAQFEDHLDEDSVAELDEPHVVEPVPDAPEPDFAEVEAQAEAEVAQPPVATAVEEEPGFAAPSFGTQDPDARAARLARVLVSDMVAYNPELHARAIENGTLQADFEDEIKKSWAEFVDQVGEEIADGTDHFTSALNQILAQGNELF